MTLVTPELAQKLSAIQQGLVDIGLRDWQVANVMHDIRAQARIGMVPALPEGLVPLRVEVNEADDEYHAVFSRGEGDDEAAEPIVGSDLDRLFLEGVVERVHVLYPRASRYGVPPYATDEGAAAYLMQLGFQVKEDLEVNARDSGDDSAEVAVDIAVPQALVNTLAKEAQKLPGQYIHYDEPDTGGYRRPIRRTLAFSEALEIVHALASKTLQVTERAYACADISERTTQILEQRVTEERAAVHSLHDLVVNHHEAIDALDFPEDFRQWPARLMVVGQGADPAAPSTCLRQAYTLGFSAARDERDRCAVFLMKDLVGLYGDTLDAQIHTVDVEPLFDGDAPGM